MDDAQRLDALLRRTASMPPEQAAPRIHAFFGGLDPAAATRLADRRPDQIGELNGAPAQLRFRANIHRITRARDALQVLDDAGKANKNDKRRLKTLNDLLTPVTVVTTGPDGRRVTLLQHRQFLSVDTDGKGRAVEVHGDLSRARRMAFMVPGMGNSLDRMPDLVARSKAVQNEAGEGTVAVTWLGYDSPSNVLQAAGKERAYDAAPGVRADLVALRLEMPPDTPITGVGHSFGTVVIGQACLYGARFDRVFFTGSPGVDPDVHSAADLHLGPQMLIVERAPGDYVVYTQWHGSDPANWPDVVRAATAGGEPVHWHQRYYRPGTESLKNAGRAVRGEIAQISRTDTSAGRETHLALGVGWAHGLRGAVIPVSIVYEGLAELRGVAPPPRLEVASRHTVPDQTQRERPER
jgi:hypothetical protein